jgi:hypothetical protein
VNLPRPRRAGARALLAATVGVGLVAAAGFAFVAHKRDPQPSRARAERPVLMLLTALPLVFGETFGLDGGSPALRALETRYKVVPISTADAANLKAGRLLLMAQPQAQPAEVLVQLDQWVRGGGHVVLLADPALDWPSKRPLGDRLRPPPAFADTGLLVHWGLRLDAPDARGPVERTVDGITVLTASPGTLVGACPLEAQGLIARCRIGKGEATVVADADFLNVDALGGRGDSNLALLLAELAKLERQ